DAVPVQSRRPALAGLGRRVVDGALDASPRHAARGGAVWADQHGRPGLSRRRVPGGDHGADADGITRLPPAEQLVAHVLHGVHLRTGLCGLHATRLAPHLSASRRCVAGGCGRDWSREVTGMPPVEAAEPYTAVLPQVDDADLLRGVHDGNRAALVALYHRHAGMVLAQIGLLVGP